MPHMNYKLNFCPLSSHFLGPPLAHRICGGSVVDFVEHQNIHGKYDLKTWGKNSCLSKVYLAMFIASKAKISIVIVVKLRKKITVWAEGTS